MTRVNSGTRVTLSLALRFFFLNIYFKKYYFFFVKKKIVKKNKILRVNDKVTRVQELTSVLNSNGNLTEGTKTRLIKNLKYLNGFFFS